MKKAITFFCSLLIMFSLTACKPGEKPPVQAFVPDPAAGYSADMQQRYTIADFKYGAEMPYARYNAGGNPDWNARSFRTRAPEYSYTPECDPDKGSEQLEYKATSTWISEPSADDNNYYTIYKAVNGQSGMGTVRADYLTYVPSLDPEGTEMGFGKYPSEYENVLNLSDYDKLTFDFKCESDDKSNVSYKIYMSNRGSEQICELYSYNGKSGERLKIEVDLTKFTKDEKQKIEFFRFEQILSDISANRKYTCRIYSIEATASTPKLTRDNSICGMNVKSEYLGNMLYTKWGAYSASGFFDSSDNKWKLWYGAGTPEKDSSDNVYYIETDNLNTSWSKPKRITTDDTTGYKLIDPSGKLKASDAQIGYGGDPGVVKVDGVYYMYFSALENGLDDGRFTHWNKIYVATSTDSKTWTVQGVCVDPSTGGSLGYGAGGPSVVYYNSEFYLYYYTQAPDYRYPNESCGLVLKKSSDGVNFGKSIEVSRSMSALDVKYVPSLRKWVGCYYAEANQFIADAKPGVRLVFSEDGVVWNFDHTNDKMPAQNFNYPINHNPGLIGNELGHGYESMFLTYGANDLPLTVNGMWFSAAQYDARQLEWSRIKIS